MLIKTRSASFQTHVAIRKLSISAAEADQAAHYRHSLVDQRLEQILTTLHMQSEGSNTLSKQRFKQERPEESPASRSDILAFEISQLKLGCAISCNCLCHTRTNINFLNTLLIGYTGSLMPSKICHRNCTNGPVHFRARATYYFPLWFVSKALVFGCRISALNDPTVFVTIRDVLADDSGPFVAVERGNSAALVMMLKERIVHPNSLDATYGRTLLHVSNSIWFV